MPVPYKGPGEYGRIPANHRRRQDRKKNSGCAMAVAIPVLALAYAAGRWFA